MPDINQYIPPYTPLWRGDDECGKCDAILIPPASKFFFMIPKPFNNGQTTYNLFINGLPSEAYIKFDSFQTIGDYYYVQISTGNDGRLTMTPTAGIEFKLPCGCYEFELGTLTVLFPDVFVNRLGIKWTIANLCPSDCREQPLQLDYKLGCGDEELSFTYYLDAGLRRVQSSVADEVNAINPQGISKRIFTRIQKTKLLRTRPLTNATHELLEYILNIPSITINGIEYSQAEGSIYSAEVESTSGYYLGEVELVSGGNVFRSCCDEVSPSS